MFRISCFLLCVSMCIAQGHVTAQQLNPSSVDKESLAQKGADQLPVLQQGEKAAKKGDFDLDIKCFTEAIELEPKNVKAYLGRGIAYVRKGDNDKAIAD